MAAQVGVANETSSDRLDRITRQCSHCPRRTECVLAVRFEDDGIRA
ncbi:hypothetical protein T02_7588 [Trichinella nativa]|uniref:Uncharacterized protein n=1 Tax=Trichinella nativa TaxID=6335 RepID=A0A0V1LNR2_9BILA|nr:hypothetical protein T02_7588 [Trichinella nativa]